MDGLSEGEGDGLAGGLFLRGDAVLDATLARTAVALVHFDLWLCSVYECCRLTLGCVIVAAVRGDRLSEEAAIVSVV